METEIIIALIALLGTLIQSSVTLYVALSNKKSEKKAPQFKMSIEINDSDNH